MNIKKWIRLAGRSCALVTLLGAVAAGEPLLTNTTSFRIPFAIESLDGGVVDGAAILFAAANGGPMEQVQRVDAAAGGFDFIAPADGRYAFAVRMTDARGELTGSSGPLSPELEVIVDTVAPAMTIRLSEAAAGKVSVSWSCENQVAPGSVRLEYAVGADGRWQPIPEATEPAGQVTVATQPGTSVSVRGYASDLAGNQGSGTAQLVLNTRPAHTTGKPALNSQSTRPVSTSLNDPARTTPDNNLVLGPNPFAAPATNPPAMNRPETNLPTNSQTGLPPSAASSSPPSAGPTGYTNTLQLPAQQPSTAPANSYAANNYAANSYAGNSYAGNSSAGTGTPLLTNHVGQNRTATPSPVVSQTPAVSQTPMTSQTPIVAPSPAGTQAPPAGRTPSIMQPPPNTPTPVITQVPGHASATVHSGISHPAAASVQKVNSRVFDIAYQVEDVGPSGVSAVELFVSENNGQEWFRYGKDADLKTPFQVDTRGEGTFGFAVRVYNGLGFSDPAPQPGELPAIVVTVDQTPPTVELTPPQVLIGDQSRILLNWHVADRNPSASPVRLEYSDSPAGPWTPLFDWQADHRGYELPIQIGLPDALYFRLLARDEVGNVATAQTPQAVVIDQRRPRAKLLRVEPASYPAGY
ncbi:MAG: hypothetical protein RIK87_11875 [Fuerstiella sp.]